MGIFDKLLGKAKNSSSRLDEADANREPLDVGVLSTNIKNALVQLTMAGSAEEFGESARNIHALAKVQAEVLVEKSNAMTEDSQLVRAVASALADLVFAMSQAETHAFDSNPFMFSGAPANIQASWLEVVKAAVHDEARALARALAAYRQLCGLEP